MEYPVPAALQTKYANPVQVEHEDKSRGIFSSFIRKSNNYCCFCGMEQLLKFPNYCFGWCYSHSAFLRQCKRYKIPASNGEGCIHGRDLRGSRQSCCCGLNGVVIRAREIQDRKDCHGNDSGILEMLIRQFLFMDHRDRLNRRSFNNNNNPGQKAQWVKMKLVKAHYS